MLYDQTRHSSLNINKFDAKIVSGTIEAILDSTYNYSIETNSLWPIHSKDTEPGSPPILTDFYMGAAGVIWAMYYLNKFLKKDTTDFCRNRIKLVLEEHLKISGTVPYDDRGSYFLGETGVRLVKQMISPDIENELQLISLAESKLNSLENELLYGLPGCLLAVNFLALFSKKDDYLIFLQTIFDTILSRREIDVESGALVWNQNFQKKIKYLGAAHGSVGNYSFLLRTCLPMSSEQRSELIVNVEKILLFYVRSTETTCNWPATLNTKTDAVLLTQWCHGATGIVTELATAIRVDESKIIDDLLLKAGNLIWEAGPLSKGISLCHGTAGSGMAFLKLYERTQDKIWLERAQAFAMHAIAQHKIEIDQEKRLRFSLWTGDLGLAIFLNDTLLGKARMPGIDLI